MRWSIGKKQKDETHFFCAGGSCEATAATAYGLKSIALSVPLGNYHNESFEGGPDSLGHRGPGPEFVDLRDVVGLLKLCEAIVKPGTELSKDPWQSMRKMLKKSYKDSLSLL